MLIKYNNILSDLQVIRGGLVLTNYAFKDHLEYCCIYFCVPGPLRGWVDLNHAKNCTPDHNRAVCIPQLLSISFILSPICICTIFYKSIDNTQCKMFSLIWSMDTSLHGRSIYWTMEVAFLHSSILLPYNYTGIKAL